MAFHLIHAVEAEFALEAALLGDSELLRATPAAPDEERIQLLQIDVLMAEDRDVWYEFEMRRRISEPKKVTFHLRFTVEKGLLPACAAILEVGNARFTAPLDARGHATITVDAESVLDTKSKRIRKPFNVGLGCPEGA